MPRAVAVGLPEPALQISASPRGYQSHFSWVPSDNFFHLLAATPYSVWLQRCCDQAAPLGKVASVDSLGTATITASA
jgi:hypothetical protein